MGLLLLYKSLLLLAFDEVVILLFFHLLELSLDLNRDSGLSDSDADDVDSRDPFLEMALEDALETLIQSVELANEYFMKGMGGTELVYLMMDFVIDPDTIIVSRICFHYVIYVIPIQLVDYLDLVEVDDYSSTGTTRNLLNLVSL